MPKYILKRCIIAVFTLLVLITIIFFLVRLLPGDPFNDPKVTDEVRARLEAYYGMDKPLIQQYFAYLGNLLKGDFGVSLIYTGRSVNSTIAQTFPYSADLGLRALGLALVVGLILGTLAAQKAGRVIDYVCVLVAIIGVSMPDFIIGALLKLIFAIKLRVLPAGLWNGFSYTILPVVALSFYTLALITRLMRHAGGHPSGLHTDGKSERPIEFPSHLAASDPQFYPADRHSNGSFGRSRPHRYIRDRKHVCHSWYG